jgi:hypothetical protein
MHNNERGLIGMDAEVLRQLDVAPSLVPVKTDNSFEINESFMKRQGEVVKSSLFAVTNDMLVPISCSDSRPRDGTVAHDYKTDTDGLIMPLFGGGLVYARNIYALMGLANLDDTAVEIGVEIGKTLKLDGFNIYRHISCAAAGAVAPIMGNIANDSTSNLKQAYSYAKRHLGKEFKEHIADQVAANAIKVKESGIFADHNEDGLEETFNIVYGKEEADKKTEVLTHGIEHEEATIGFINVDGFAINPSVVYRNSVYGKGSYLFNNVTASKIENALASSPHAVKETLLAKHARFMLIWATAQALPNDVLGEFDINKK